MDAIIKWYKVEILYPIPKWVLVDEIHVSSVKMFLRYNVLSKKTKTDRKMEYEVFSDQSLYNLFLLF